jgi:hypothetical protein
MPISRMSLGSASASAYMCGVTPSHASIPSHAMRTRWSHTAHGVELSRTRTPSNSNRVPTNPTPRGMAACTARARGGSLAGLDGWTRLQPESEPATGVLASGFGAGLPTASDISVSVTLSLRRGVASVAGLRNMILCSIVACEIVPS